MLVKILFGTWCALFAALAFTLGLDWLAWAWCVVPALFMTAFDNARKIGD